MPRLARSFLQTWPSGLLAAVMVLLTACGGVAHATEPCTTEPNFKTAQQGHWYYRVDRVTQRKCWFLARSGTELRSRVAAKTHSVAKPAHPFAAAPKAQETSGSAWRALEQPNAAPDAGIPPSPAVLALSAHEPEVDLQPETRFGDEPSVERPIFAAPESRTAEPAMPFSVDPAHLIAVLAAALGLAAVVGGLVFKYSVLFSA